MFLGAYSVQVPVAHRSSVCLRNGDQAYVLS